MTNFQIITSEKVTSRCMRAYSLPVSGCAVTDFVFGNECSASCVQGLEVAASRIEKACADDDIDADSLLGMIVTGHLVEVLCPRNEQTTVTTTVRPTTTLQPTPSAGQDTDIQDPITTIRNPPDSTTATRDETSPTAEPTRGEQTTRLTSRPSTSTDSPAESDTTPTTLPTFTLGTSPTNTITLTPSTTAADDDAAAPSATGAGPEDDADSRNGINPELLGGGSPFNPLAASMGARIRHRVCGVLASALAAAAVVLL